MPQHEIKILRLENEFLSGVNAAIKEHIKTLENEIARLQTRNDRLEASVNAYFEKYEKPKNYAAAKPKQTTPKTDLSELTDKAILYFTEVNEKSLTGKPLIYDDYLTELSVCEACAKPAKYYDLSSEKMRNCVFMLRSDFSQTFTGKHGKTYVPFDYIGNLSNDVALVYVQYDNENRFIFVPFDTVKF